MCRVSPAAASPTASKHSANTSPSTTTATPDGPGREVNTRVGHGGISFGGGRGLRSGRQSSARKASGASIEGAVARVKRNVRRCPLRNPAALVQ